VSTSPKPLILKLQSYWGQCSFTQGRRPDKRRTNPAEQKGRALKLKRAKKKSGKTRGKQTKKK